MGCNQGRITSACRWAQRSLIVSHFRDFCLHLSYEETIPDERRTWMSGVTHSSGDRDNVISSQTYGSALCTPSFNIVNTRRKMWEQSRTPLTSAVTLQLRVTTAEMFTHPYKLQKQRFRPIPKLNLDKSKVLLLKCSCIACEGMCGIAGNLYFGIIALILSPKKQ